MAADAQTIADRIKRTLARTRTPNIDVALLDELNMTIEELEESPNHYWFQIQTSTPEVLSAGSSVLLSTPPADFLQEYGEYGLRMLDDDGNYRPCVKDDLDVILEKTSVSYFGTPFYSLDNDLITIGPTLDEAKTFMMQYIAKTTTMTSLSDTNVWTQNAGTLLYGITGERYAIAIQSQKVQYFSGIKQQALKSLRDLNTARTEANVRRTMGD